jgi:hypothetical protein
VKISVEPTQGTAWNAEAGEFKSIGVVRVEWQAKKGGKREHVGITMDSQEPAAMLAAAAAYFKTQEMPF